MKHTNPFLQSLLALSLAAVCSGAVATESGVDGASTTGNTPVDSSTVWAPAVSRSVLPDATFPAGNTYNCAVTCAATFENTTIFDDGNDANYYLGINTTSAGAPPSGSWRIISFPENTGLNDADYGPIATTYLFTGLPEATSTTFYCLARKVGSTDPTGEVTDASITASCSDYQW